MKQHDLERVLHQQVDNIHLSDESVRRIRMETREEKPVKRKMSMVLVIALIAVMLGGVALAAGGGILEFMNRITGKEYEILPSGEQLFTSEIGAWEDEYVIYTVSEGVYDGHAVGLMVEITPKQEDVLVLSRGCMALQCFRYKQTSERSCMPMLKVEEEEELTPQALYDQMHAWAKDNGYTKIVLVQVDPHYLNAYEYPKHGMYKEWENNKESMMISIPVKAGAGAGETVSVELEFNTCLYDDSSKPIAQYDRGQSTTAKFTLATMPALWEKNVELAIDVPEYGIRIDRVRMNATTLGTYADVVCTVISSEQAIETEMIGVDEQDEFVGYGILEELTRWIPSFAEDGRVHVFDMSMPPLPECPDALYVKLSNRVERDRAPVTIKLPIQ